MQLYFKVCYNKSSVCNSLDVAAELVLHVLQCFLVGEEGVEEEEGEGGGDGEVVGVEVGEVGGEEVGEEGGA